VARYAAEMPWAAIYPQEWMARVFISYARVDAELAQESRASIEGGVTGTRARRRA
jgi:hypothetical protein